MHEQTYDCLFNSCKMHGFENKRACPEHSWDCDICGEKLSADMTVAFMPETKGLFCLPCYYSHSNSLPLLPENELHQTIKRNGRSLKKKN